MLRHVNYKPDILVNLDVAATRLNNKHRMVIRDSDESGLIRIGKRSELLALAKLKHLFKILL